MKKSGFTVLILMSVISLIQAQLPGKKYTREQYIEKYKDIAIEEMNAFHIPASITLAQGILESASGNSKLALKANNHFGIKCHKGWNGQSIKMDDDEKNECFRKYKHAEDSFKDHSVFLATRDRYGFLFDLPITDYKAWAKGLKKAGYATNPKYAHLLIKLIEDYNLDQYDKFYQDAKYIAARKKTRENTTVARKLQEDFSPITISESNRKIYQNNGVKFIYAKQGDTPFSIASDFNIYKWQIRKYNSLSKKDKIAEGQQIYIERKKNKAKEKYHLVEAGETLADISQIYGVRLKKLCRYNTLRKDAMLYPNQKILLRK